MLWFVLVLLKHSVERAVREDQNPEDYGMFIALLFDF